jgi:hypothetical protein
LDKWRPVVPRNGVIGDFGHFFGGWRRTGYGDGKDKDNSRSPFDFSQGRLFGDDNKKSKVNCTNDVGV